MSSSLLWRLFSFKGRVNRGGYAILFFALFVFSSVVQRYVMTHYVDLEMIKAHKPELAFHIPPSVGLALFGVYVALNWIGLANQVKRLHDFGWSGWMVLSPLGAMIALMVTALLPLVAGQAKVAGGLAILGVVAGVLGTAILCLMLFFRRGDDGENGHPRGPQDEEDHDVRARMSSDVPIRMASATGSASAKTAVALSTPKDECQLNVYRPPQRQPKTFGRRGA